MFAYVKKACMGWASRVGKNAKALGSAMLDLITDTYKKTKSRFVALMVGGLISAVIMTKLFILLPVLAIVSIFYVYEA